MVPYGETLRQIRVQKGLTMKELADGICSVSFLSKFERGDSDITLGLFTKILEKLMLSFDEFLYIHNDYMPDQLEQFFKNVSTAYFNRNSAQLKHLKKQEIEKWEKYRIDIYYCNVLMLQVYERIVDAKEIDENVDKEDVKILSNYLFSVEVWGYYELQLYSATMLFLEAGMVVQLSKTAYEKSIRYRNLKKVNEAIIAIIMNTIVYLLGPVNRFNEKMEYRKEISEFFSYLETIAFPEGRLLERVELLHLKGAYELRIGNREEGIAKIQHAIQILSDLGSYGNATRIEKYLQQILDCTK
ncbi:helix-turn-helix domain-containing protein [Bacillus sp. APMAM]|nr:helix-turn-helix domain-containing protein [Bacillus sp. APMAM]